MAIYRGGGILLDFRCHCSILILGVKVHLTMDGKCQTREAIYHQSTCTSNLMCSQVAVHVKMAVETRDAAARNLILYALTIVLAHLVKTNHKQDCKRLQASQFYSILASCFHAY